MKVYRSVLPAVHPLKQKPLESRLKNKRKRKPDTEEPPVESSDFEAEKEKRDAKIEAVAVREKTSDLVSPPKKKIPQRITRSARKRRCVT